MTLEQELQTAGALKASVRFTYEYKDDMNDTRPIAVVSIESSDCRADLVPYSSDAPETVTRLVNRIARDLKLLPSLLWHIKNEGGGEYRIEDWGRLCFCPRGVTKPGKILTKEIMMNPANHATACNDLVELIAKLDVANA